MKYSRPLSRETKQVVWCHVMQPNSKSKGDKKIPLKARDYPLSLAGCSL